MLTTVRQKICTVAVALSLLAGCTADAGPKQVGGGLAGAAAGGLIGAQIGRGPGTLASTAIGSLLGAYLGSQMGRSLDQADQMYAERAEQQAQGAPIGQTIRWNNPDTGNQGSFTPVRDGTDQATGAYCREYRTTVTVGGKTQDAYGTACRQPDGSWKILQ